MSGDEGYVNVIVEPLLSREEGSGAPSEEDMAAFVKALEAAGLAPRRRHFFSDSEGGPVGLANEFSLVFQTAIPVAGVLIGAWIRGHLGRKLRVQVGDKVIEASSVEDANRLVDVVKQLDIRSKKNKGR